MNNLLHFFPGDPRPVQEEILTEVEKVWSKADVIAIVAPVASGKSRCAVAIGQAADKPTLITTPTRVLVEQYREDFPRLDWMGRKSDYAGRRQFFGALKRAEKSSLLVTNYHAVCANRLQKPVMVVDEAHNTIKLHQERHAFHVWKHNWYWPDDLETLGDAFSWLETVQDKKLERALEEIKNAGTYTLELGEAYYRGEYRECLKFIPLTIKDKTPWLWNPTVKKLVLMSATIGKQDLVELGLDKRRCALIEAPSPIPLENRPVVYDPIAPMDYNTKPESVKLLAARINELLKEKKGKGLIHCTYSVAAMLRPLLDKERLLFHTKDNRQAVYQQFLESENKVLVGSGFAEGIDLKGSRAEFQILTQVPFANMQDPAVAAKAVLDPTWYAWECVKVLLQMFGRVCRAPDDKGETRILDSNFRRFYLKNKHLFPDPIAVD